MCGMCGVVDATGSHPETAVQAMTATLTHRGPDGDGVWSDPAVGVALGHRRLAIVDLSPAGRQPMVSQDGRYVVAYNGEIYNFQELRRDLAAVGVSFRGHSDTEVMLEACARWGVAATVRRLVGIFAIALWDRAERALTLIRDQIGVKPLYWGQFGDLLLFGSELKALRAHPGCKATLNRDAAAAFLRWSYVPAPETIYKGIFKQEPGTTMTFAAGRPPVVDRYWSLRRVVAEGRNARETPVSDPKEAVDQLEALLRDAIGRQMIADVPLGAFLSGGIDSSTVVALMQAQSAQPVRSFSIGFHEEGYNEADHAKAVAAHLKTDHTELYVAPEQARDVIPDLPFWFDEPFADSSQIPTCLVSALTRRHVTVALSGDGGDELFTGYRRYMWGDRLRKIMQAVPKPARGLGAVGLRALADAGAPLARRAPGVWLKLRRLTQVSDILALPDADALYRRLLTQWDDPDALVPGAREPRGLPWDETARRDIPDFVERMQFFDGATYLPDDILVKVDRASMAVALEARVPLLDHRVIEFAWRLPPSLKRREGVGKWALRQVLYRHVPQKLMDRPKMGFGAPIDAWLRGPLRDWADALLDERRLRDEGVFAPAQIRKRWEEHRAGTRNWQYPLWNVLMFQAWRERWAPEQD